MKHTDDGVTYGLAIMVDAFGDAAAVVDEAAGEGASVVEGVTLVATAEAVVVVLARAYLSRMYC